MSTNRYRDEFPDGIVVIFSKYVYFQDIIEVACLKMDELASYLRFSGRQ